MVAFGPVPSRRLGRSLGINNIPAKYCSYSCIYCQLVETVYKETIRQSYFKPQFVYEHVKNRVETVLSEGETIDYLTFVSSGEPTLDEYLAETISLLKDLNIKIAVISNASLIWRSDVQAALKLADWVSFKVDSVDQIVWHKINRPVDALLLERILTSIVDFSREFDGVLTTETMFLDQVNIDQAGVESLINYLTNLNPDKSYFAVPTRPVAEQGYRAPEPAVMNEIYQVARKRLSQLELLISEEEDTFSSKREPSSPERIETRL